MGILYCIHSLKSQIQMIYTLCTRSKTRSNLAKEIRQKEAYDSIDGKLVKYQDKTNDKRVKDFDANQFTDYSNDLRNVEKSTKIKDCSSQKGWALTRETNIDQTREIQDNESISVSFQLAALTLLAFMSFAWASIYGFQNIVDKLSQLNILASDDMFIDDEQ